MSRPSTGMNVISSALRGARRLVHTDPALLGTLLSAPVLRPGWGSAPLVTCPQTRKFTSKQVTQDYLWATELNRFSSG